MKKALLFAAIGVFIGATVLKAATPVLKCDDITNTCVDDPVDATPKAVDATPPTKATDETPVRRPELVD